MFYRSGNSRHAGMRISPWIILGSTAILIVVVIVLAVQNANRERRYMSEILSAKGAALIRAVEAGARTGMMGMSWGGQQIQQLIKETARLPDVRFMAVVDPDGRVVAHSESDQVGKPFDQGRKLIHVGSNLQENWELVDLGEEGRVFEVHRPFRPMRPGRNQLGGGRMQGMMRRHSMMTPPEDDWFSSADQEKLMIVAGLDVDTFEAAIREDFKTTMILSVILVLLGFGGFVSLFWMYSYRTTKRSLQDASAFADKVVASLPVGLIATDQVGHITFFNAAAERITGVRREQAAGQLVNSLLPSPLCGLIEALDRGLNINEKQMECRFPGNRMVPVSVSAARIVNEAGAFVGQILILRDLGEVRRLQDEVRRQEKMAALGGLAAGVAHEIRNPLSSIKGMATFFFSQFEEGSEGREAAGVMVQEVDRLNRVITELLAFARPSDVKRQPTDMAPLVARSVGLIQKDAANQKIDVDLAMDDDLCRVSIDPDRMAQCLLNLLINAIDAMSGGGRLTVRCESIDMHEVRIAISDTGPGMSPEELTQIFDPYYTTKSKGTGLGLAIVHKIVEAHGARLNVESAPGRGTTFFLRLACADRETKDGEENDGKSEPVADRR